MKVEKLVNILLDINKSLEQSLGDLTLIDRKWEDENWKANKIEKLEALRENSIYFKKGKEEAGLTGLCKIYVKDKKGCNLTAEIRCYALNISELEFIRTYSIEGTVEIELPIGVYKIEASKGSTYSIEKQVIQVTSNYKQELTFYLSQGINLREIGWLAGDLHHHSIYSSPIYGGTDLVEDTLQEIRYSMEAMGLDFGALSDHHNIKNHSVWKSLATESFIPILSKEISTSNGHVLALGVPEDIVYHIPEQKDRTDQYLRDEFIRITDEIKLLGGLPQLNHPLEHQKSIAWNQKYMDLINIFETIEVWNGSAPMMCQTVNGLAISMWIQLLEEGRYIPATTGSDTHNIKADDYRRYSKWFQEIKKEIREGRASCEIEEIWRAFEWLYNRAYPVLEKWVKRSLTSGSVRTYVYTGGIEHSQAILNALRRGNSFLTNGPILIPKIKGVGPGEQVELMCDEDEVEVDLTILANRRLSWIRIYGNNHYSIQISVEEIIKESCGMYDYSTTVTLTTQDKKWFFFEVHEDCTNLAITNPIFIIRKSL